MIDGISTDIRGKIKVIIIRKKNVCSLVKFIMSSNAIGFAIYQCAILASVILIYFSY